MNSILGPVKTRSLSEEVFDTIRQAIFIEELRPGDLIREVHLAKDLHVSQVTVREALGKLERYGLVVREANRRTYVTKHTSQEIRERLALRVALEEMAFADAAQRMTKEDISALERKLTVLSSRVGSDEYFEAAQADLEFHRYVWQKSGNTLLYTTLDQLTAPLFAFISIMRSSGMERLRDTVKPHKALLDALRSGSTRKAKQAIREHIDGSYNEFLNSGVESFEKLVARRA